MKWIKEKLGGAIQMLKNPKFFLCFAIAWMITNGWSWIFLAMGPSLHIPWMTKIGIAWQGILWMPFTVEKPITFAIGVALYKWIFRKSPRPPEMN